MTMSSHHTCHHHRRRDEGAVLPLVLVMSLVISIVIASLAGYVATNLRYGQVVEDRADRLAAADGGLRYAIERLQNSAYAGCLSNLGNTGFTIDFPVEVNEATVDVTCTKGSSGIGSIKAWALIVTGEGVPGGQWFWKSQGGGGQNKLLGGPVWISDPGRSDLKSPVLVEDGDIWYHRPDCENPSLTLESNLSFAPAYRGTYCVESTWKQVYTAPLVGSVPAAVNQLPTVDTDGCTIFEPGRYVGAGSVPLGNNTYFKAGNYYLQDVVVEATGATVTGGWADPGWGDQQFIANAPCDDAISADATAPNNGSGVTFYIGGSTKFEVGNHGSIEILRRLQGDSLVSIQAIESTSIPAGMIAHTLGYNDNVVWTKSGNNSDLAIHGLLWAPRAQLEFGNVTNAANGQLLGGAAVARMILQASASASAFIIRVETSEIPYELRIDSTATKSGQSTTMTAVVQVDDQGNTAVNSLRVRD
jgi:hypothetical protein